MLKVIAKNLLSGAPKFNGTKRHTLKHTVYFNENEMKTWLSDNSLLNHLGNLRGISTGRSFKDKHKRNVSLRQIHSLISLENEQEKAEDLLDLALVAGQHVLRIRSFKKYAKKRILAI